MNIEKTGICAHELCNCSTAEGQYYCSEYCREAAETEGSVRQEMSEACGCGHPDCDQA